ncbi:DUF167 family protein [Patescibacteria group bacterium]|nr:DUF167 family protein [Patescibacteria group bacterium]
MFVKVKVYPETKKEKLVKKSEDSYDIYVKDKAKFGMANRRVAEILANYFGVAEGKIKLVKGGAHRSKIYEI